MKDEKPPVSLDYSRPAKRLHWPADPFTPARIGGAAAGFVVSFVAAIWNRWAEHVIRVPLLWYQHQWWIAFAGAFCIALTLAMIRNRFFISFGVGALAGLVLLVANYTVEVFFFGVDLLGRLTGLRIN